MFARERKKTLQSSSQDADSYNFDALYVILFDRDAKKSTIQWLVDQLEKKQLNGGSELLVKSITTEDDETAVLVKGDTMRLLEAAELMEITKEDKYGNIREFAYNEIDLFLKPGSSLENLLNTTEKQRIILNEIMNLSFPLKDQLVGYAHIKLYPGQSIVQVCQDNGIIKQVFPLHEKKVLTDLEKKWYAFPMRPQPLDDIRKYFGEAVAFYFAFLEFYTFALIPPALVGLLQMIITLDMTYLYVALSVLKMIWLTLFFECWKRKSNEFAFVWGTLKTISLPQLNPRFRGVALEQDPVTKQYTPVYPGYKRHLKVYCGTTPVVALCICFAVIVMLIYFRIEDYCIGIYNESGDQFGWILMQIPGLIYALLIPVMSLGFKKIAYMLTEWENHKTRASFENHRVMKMILFEFANNFIALGYIAFYLQDIEMLKWQIGIMMIANQLINQVQEALLPIVIRKGLCFFKKHKPEFENLDSQSAAVLNESQMWPYEDTYDDYLEIFIQFGYVFLFSSVYPLSAMFALINNVLEVWADGFKLCRVYQRPQARPVKGIGVWQIAFETLGILSVMTNSALICLSPSIKSYIESTSSTWLIVAVIVEHLIIAIKMVISYLISDVPKWVTVEIQKARYESLQALKHERLMSEKKEL